MSYITEEEKDVSQIGEKQQQQQLVNRQWERFINQISDYKKVLLKSEQIICQQQSQQQTINIHQQTQFDKHQEENVNKSTFIKLQFLNQQQTIKTKNTEYHNNRNKQWQIFLFSLRKYKYKPFKLSIEKFQTIIKLIITRDQQFKGIQLINEGEQVEIRGDDRQVVEGGRLGQQLRQEEQVKGVDWQNNEKMGYVQTVFDQISNYGQNANNNLSKQQQKQQQIHSHNNKQQTTFDTFNTTKQPHIKLKILQTLQPTIKHINPKTKYQLINQINTIKDIQTIQFVIDIYNYINVFLWIKQQQFLDQTVLFAVMRRFQDITAIELSWRDIDKDIDEDIDEEQQQLQLYQQEQKQLLTIKQSQQIIKRRKNQIIINQHIRHKFYSQAFFRCLSNKNTTPIKSDSNNNYKQNKIVKLFNHYCQFLTNHPNPHQFDTKFYIHYIHTQAYRRKYFLIANIMNSKCFLCQTERFVSNSLYQVKIYQKMVKRINNIIYPQIEEF